MDACPIISTFYPLKKTTHRWTSLPLPCWRLLMTHLHARHTLFNCSVTCRSFARVADELATALKGVPARDVPRALRRFDRATSLEIEAPGGTQAAAGAADAAAEAAAAATPEDGAGSGDEGEGDDGADAARRREALYADLCEGLSSATAADAGRVEALRVAGYPRAAAALAGAAFDGRWARVRRLELDGVGTLHWLELGAAARALPALRELAVRGVDRCGPDWPSAEPGALAGLDSLELADFRGGCAAALPAQLPPVRGLRRLALRGAPGLRSLPLQGWAGLEDLEIADAPDLELLPGLASLSRLASLALRGAPLLWRPRGTALDGLAALPQLLSLELTASGGAAGDNVGGVQRLPRSVSALTALTSLVVGLRMAYRGPEGNEPEDFAPLGRGNEDGGEGLLRAWGLRRLVARGFDGPLHLPEGMERFTALEVRARLARGLACGGLFPAMPPPTPPPLESAALSSASYSRPRRCFHSLSPPPVLPPKPQELDLGGRQEIWNLGPWLLRLPALRRLVVPRRAGQQGVFEALALRNDPRQVDVEEEGGEGSDGGGRGWGEDAEGWADEGF